MTPAPPDPSVQSSADDWISALLEDDATHPVIDAELEASATSFASQVMTSLPKSKHTGYTDYTGLAPSVLAASGCALAGFILSVHGSDLMAHFDTALHMLRLDTMVATAMPFVVLLGLALFVYRLESE